MKKRFFLALACAAMMLPASAQWTPDDNNLVPIANDTSLEYERPAAIRTADGSTLLAYRTYGYHVNPKTGHRETQRNFYLHYQKLDKAGNKLFPDDGVLISYKRTETAAYSRPTIDTLSNGNIVFSFADYRPGDSTYISISDLRAYAYCYTQDGDTVWSADGVRMPVIPQLPDATERRHVQEKVTVSGDHIYFTAITEEMIKAPGVNDSIVATTIRYLQLSCLDYSGNIVASRIDSAAHYTAYDVRPAPNGNLYFVYTNIQEGYSAECLNSSLENVWNNPAVVDTVSVVSRTGFGYEGSIAPKDMIPLSDGGLAIVYHAYPHNKGTAPLFYNRLNADGTTLPDHVRLTDSIALHHDHVCTIEGDTLHVFEDRSRNINGLRTEHYLYYSRVRLSDGSRLIDEPIGYILDMNVNAVQGFIGLTKAGGYFQLISEVNDEHFNTYYNYVATYDPDAKIQFRKTIYGGDRQLADVEYINEGNMAYSIVTKGSLGEGGLWMSCVDLTDYTNSKPVIGDLPGKFSVNADGKQVQFSQGNVEYMKSHEFAHISDRQWEEQDGSNKWIARESYAEWLDLFGWGTGTTDEVIKYDTLASYATFTDWGNLNFRNLNSEPGTWRTMSADEWDYLLNGRENAAQKRTIGGIRWKEEAASTQPGAILLPDDFEMPEGITMNMNATDFYTNSYVFLDWKLLQDAGAVFLPLDGYRKDTAVYDYDGITSSFPSVGHYWTSTPDGELNAKKITIDKNGLSIVSAPRCLGMNVRLVKDVDDPQGFDETIVNRQSSNRKFIKDGQLFIIRDERIYNATGVRVK